MQETAPRKSKSPERASLKEPSMDYYIGRTVAAGFEDTVTRVVEALKKEGFAC